MLASVLFVAIAVGQSVDAAPPAWRPPVPLQILLFVAAPLGPIAFMAGLFLADARITGWHALAERFAAKAPPGNTVNKWQDGGAGTIG
ncbi:MAG TPA: hypothetical protein VF683_10215, partial [Chthoniobacterales bacterium]